MSMDVPRASPMRASTRSRRRCASRAASSSSGSSPDEQMDRIEAELEPFLGATPAGGDEFTGCNTRRTGSLLARSREFGAARRAPDRARRARPCARRSRDELSAAPHPGDRDRSGRARAARAPRPVGVRLLPVPGGIRGRVPHDVGDERLHRGERRDARDSRAVTAGTTSCGRRSTRRFPRRCRRARCCSISVRCITAAARTARRARDAA